MKIVHKMPFNEDYESYEYHFSTNSLEFFGTPQKLVEDYVRLTPRRGSTLGGTVVFLIGQNIVESSCVKCRFVFPLFLLDQGNPRTDFLA